MDGGGSCCIAPRAASDYDPSKAHRIMLKFRPIAPKPAVTGAHVTHETSGAAVMNCMVAGRKRRRYRRIKEQKRETAAVTTTTLPLLPPPAVKMVGSIVTVESLTDTWVVEYGLGYNDGERMGRLNDDHTCPGFVSDGFGRVVWTNWAYREMVRGGVGDHNHNHNHNHNHDQEEEEEVGEQVVSLMVKEEDQRRVLMGCGAAFTCRVRVQYYGCRSMTIPCDAWRMDGGGFAWRLDIKAALRL